MVFNLPLADYEVRADYLSGRFWSPVFRASDVTVDIAHGLAAVHVVESGFDLFDVPVYIFDEAGKYLGRVERTDSAGMARFLVPEGTYKFRVDYSGSQIWSDAVSILTDGQSDIDLDVELLLSDLTTDPKPNRFDGTPPVYEPQKMLVAGLGSLTGILPVFTTGQIAVDRIYFYISDHLGTPQIVVDEFGKVVWTADYQPFGSVDDGSSSKADNKFRFSGQYYDEETGLHYNYHRYYDPKTGRYLTSDPIGLLGGINLYTYASNNSINLVDPLGLYESQWYLKWVPGQHLWDRGVTALEKGNYGWAAAYFTGMVGEQVFAALSFGKGWAARTGTQCAVNATVGRYSGKLVKVNVKDLAADALAKRIGGKSSVRFATDTLKREFDVVSRKFIGQTKPALKQIGSQFRNQAKATFKAAQSTGKKAYFHFEGQPSQQVINKIGEYGRRYGVNYIIDTKPLF